MKSKKSHIRLSKTAVIKQLSAISALRTKGFSVAEACKRVGVPVPTYYFRAKSAGKAAPKILRAKPVALKAEKQIDGRTLAALRRNKTKHAAVAGRIRTDLIELRKLGRRLLAAAKTLG